MTHSSPDAQTVNRPATAHPKLPLAIYVSVWIGMIVASITAF